MRGFLHIPEAPNGDALVLAHGASGNAQAPLLRALAETLADAGLTVLLCNLPYRQARSFGPPGPGDAARDRAGLKNAISAIQNMMGDVGAPPNAGFVRWERRIWLGGHSYGGRQASMLCAEEPELVPGLLLLSYPLHPPRRPEQQRTQHLPDLRTPTLFVHGTRDPFATIEELQKAIKMIPAKTKLIPVEGAGHDLGFKAKAAPQALVATIAAAFRDFPGGGRPEAL